MSAACHTSPKGGNLPRGTVAAVTWRMPQRGGIAFSPLRRHGLSARVTELTPRPGAFAQRHQQRAVMRAGAVVDEAGAIAPVFRHAAHPVGIDVHCQGSG